MNHTLEPGQVSAAAGFLEYLRARASLSEGAAAGVLRVHRDTLDRIPQILLKLGLYSEEALASHMAEFAGAQRLTTSIAVDEDLDHGVAASFLRAHELVILRMDGDRVEAAGWDATDEYVSRALEFATQRRAHLMIGTRTQILAALDAAAPGPAMEAADRSLEPVFDGEEVDRLKDLASEEPVIRLVQRIVDEAVQQKASDIHIEPSDAALHVRYRRDGLLHEVHTQARALAAPMISRIKVMAGLNIAERRLPQDGRIRVTIQGKEIDFRVATTPTLHGESVVLRILDRQDVALDFAALGFDEAVSKVIRDSIARPYGIVLVTGPTGSGKTTTLYAALKEINTPNRKILTVEDPVEYVLKGINQVPVKPQIGLTFASALRAFLRQDPDIMMVGEIRDRETAQIAIQAALTGHLLLSTLHTNSAAAAVTRLLDMGIDDYLLTSTLHLILGQRLLRKLCEHCRRPYPPGLELQRRFGISAPATWFAAVGCAACQDGYRGRTTVVEALRMSDCVRGKILARADAHEIERTAVQDGMRTLLQHGLDRVAAGVTTIEEVLRVTNPG